MTRTIKAAIEEAFIKAGGSDYLAQMATEQPAAFMTLLGKVLPMQVDHTSSDGSMAPPGLTIFYGGKPPAKADAD
jgi:hypothetical protein